MKYEELLKHEDVAWLQISKSIWLKKVDGNTKFFHKTANCYKSCIHLLFFDPG